MSPLKLFSSKKVSRRSFLKSGLRLSVLAFLGIGYESRNNLRTEQVNLDFPNLPDSLHGFRIVQISDLHASYWVGRDYLIKDPIRYQAGLIKEHYGYTYVNRGIGTLVFPFRFAAPPEITCFTLRKFSSEKI